ncbi:hypothetical protein PVK06_003939 [Gossypium arboreum]|uniref:Uncharacterized protein n=1 Tax=Gossypium arboreum TaxID=29729 RepID=A0ABR0QQL7_GOSAR|nr:hypothetical protein PVK06_003939 [Gossypium arboreum]
MNATPRLVPTSTARKKSIPSLRVDKSVLFSRAIRISSVFGSSNNFYSCIRFFSFASDGLSKVPIKWSDVAPKLIKV